MQDIRFHRLFSKTMYKDLKLPLGEMTFSKDFVTDTRGDLYPVIEKSEDCHEWVAGNRYSLRAGRVQRLMGSFFPYATYEVRFMTTGGSCGFCFRLPDAQARITCDGQTLHFSGDREEEVELPWHKSFVTMIVSCRPGAFDVYFPVNEKPEFFRTFEDDRFSGCHQQSVFQRSFVSLLAQGGVSVHKAESYIDCGTSQADIRPIRYENGDVMVENGQVYLTVSIRMQWEKFQGILAWTPATSQFRLTGALFYDSGDGFWQGDVAASILYHRERKQWLLWVCSFSHDHILGHAAFDGDIRFGVNVVDITLMEKAGADRPITEFLGFEGDEDPDFYYNETEKKWYMAVCRLDPAIRKYKYVFFRSDQPFSGYQCIGKGYDGAETGGSFVTFRGEKVFACGNDFKKRANYRVYSKDGMQEASFDYDDGGFRGWGTILPISMGSRKRYFWLTFDRHNGSSYNWSYGNLYCFEAIL